MAFLKKYKIFLLTIFLLGGGVSYCVIPAETHQIELHFFNMQRNPVLVTKFGYAGNPRMDAFVMRYDERPFDRIFGMIDYNKNDKNFVLEFTDQATGKKYAYQFPMIKEWDYKTCTYRILIKENGLFVRGCEDTDDEDLE